MARIVLADESELVLDLMRIFLSEDGYELSSVTTASDLRTELVAQEGKADLLILSADLEQTSMTECITSLRDLACKPDLHVLVTIAPGTAVVLHEIEALTRVESINKPFDMGSFLAKIKVISLLENFGGNTQGAIRPSIDSSPTVSSEPVGTLSPPSASLTSDLVTQWLEHEGRRIVEQEVRRYLSEQGEDALQEIIWKVVPELAEAQLRTAIAKITEELESVEQ
jgi:CheY-like chemotaxis protein